MGLSGFHLHVIFWSFLQQQQQQQQQQQHLYFLL